MSQIIVSPAVAVLTLVVSAMLNYAIVNAAAVHLPDVALYAMGIANVGVTTFAIAVNIRKPQPGG